MLTPVRPHSLVRAFTHIEGVAIHKTFQVLGIGDSWGEDEVLLDSPGRPTRQTKAMTYLRVMCTAREDFRTLEVWSCS